MGLQGTEEVYVDWPVAEGSLTPTDILNTDGLSPRATAIRSNLHLTIEQKQSEVPAVTVWLLRFGVTRWNFERVTGRLTPACWVDVWVI